MISDRNVRVVVVEDQERTREGLAALVSGTPGYGVTGTYAEVETALDDLSRARPDVMLLDIELPGMSGIEGVRRVKALLPGVEVLMLTVFSDPERVFEAICAGASGYLLKDTPPARLLAAITEARDGGAPMSPEVARKVVTMFQTLVPPRRVDHRLSPGRRKSSGSWPTATATRPPPPSWT